MNGPGVPALTLEVGPRRRVDREAVQTAEAGVLGVLHGQGWAVRRRPHSSLMSGALAQGESPYRKGRCAHPLVSRRPVQDGAALAEVRSLAVRERLHAVDAGFVVALPEVRT